MNRCSICGKATIDYDLISRVGYGGKRVYTCVDCLREGERQATAHICISMSSQRMKDLSNSVWQRERR